MALSVISLLAVFVLTAPCQFTRAFEDDLVGAAAVQQEAVALPLDSFTYDIVVSQRVDKEKKTTGYWALGNSSSEAIYTRNGDDTGKDVIVLTNQEDAIVHLKTKTIFIVLKKKEGADYYLAAAVLRNATSDSDKLSPMKVKAGDKDKIIEWIIFDSHFFPTKDRLMMRSYFCATTFIVACEINTGILIPPEKFQKKVVPVAAPAQKLSRLTDFKIVNTDASDSEADADFFEDMDATSDKSLLHPVEGAFSGALDKMKSLGSFSFSGFGRAFGRRRREAPPQTNTTQEAEVVDQTLYFPGWKTQFEIITKDVILKHEKDIFYGFGNCPAQPIDSNQLKSLTNKDEIGMFYLKVLRVDCIPDRVAVLKQLLEENTILVGEDKVLRMNLNNPKLMQKKVGLKEVFQLTSAAEFHAFTDTYMERLKTPVLSPISPLGAISRSMDVFTQVILKLIYESRTRARSHMVYLTRYLLLILKSVNDKLQQDAANLKGHDDDLKLSQMDRLQVISLISFIRQGLHANTVDNGQDPGPIFQDFQKKNEKSLKAGWLFAVG